jgi:hypothetical protein
MSTEQILLKEIEESKR